MIKPRVLTPDLGPPLPPPPVGENEQEDRPPLQAVLAKLRWLLEFLLGRTDPTGTIGTPKAWDFRVP